MKRLDEWSKNLNNLARISCDHVEDGVDELGHQRRPCVRCVKRVRHFLETYHMVLLIKADNVRKRVDAGEEMPMVSLAAAFFIAASVLDPATAVAIDGWGPA